MIKKILLLATVLIATGTVNAQDFINLGKYDLRIDSMLPTYTYIHEIGADYADSTYSVAIEYPEFIDMTKDEVERYCKIAGKEKPGEMPDITSSLCVERKQGQLDISFVPIVYREHKYQKLVSFKLSIEGKAKVAGKKIKTATEPRYAAHSVLASGKWVKIRVPSTGYYQITAEAAKKVGFTDISRVRIFGYGGAVQPEALTDAYLRETDDLKEIPAYMSGNKKVFFAQGSVSWQSNTATARKLNNYSLYGYYFLTEGDTAQTITADEMKSRYYPDASDFHTLYEKDEFSWYHGGRELFEKGVITASGNTYNIKNRSNGKKGQLAVTITADAQVSPLVTLNGKELGNVTINAPVTYSKANIATKIFNVDSLGTDNVVKISCNTNANVRLDNIILTTEEPAPMADLDNSSLEQPEYVAYIDNQDLHADSAYQMVIVVPESEKWLSQAQRLKALHEEKDSMRVKIVPAYELYHEFSSGTPDANAYRRYMKMLYDKATCEAEMPRYLLLFGSCAWDNRMIIDDWKQTKTEDYLLCYESSNSFSETVSYILEDYFGYLDDGEGGNHKTDKTDLGIGRLTATNEEEAKIMVDKIVNYVNNENAGDWQNQICMIGDDANENMHMDDAESIAQIIEAQHPGYNIKRVYTDAYTLERGASGDTYPEVTKILKEQMTKGALIMNYTGHGSASQISHEKILVRNDFSSNSTKGLPMWITASCDIMPIDAKTENHGENAMLNPNGGAIAFLGTTRTVYANYNRKINQLYTNFVLSSTNGVQNSIGDALRLAKNKLVDGTSSQDLSENKFHFVLLGDPAMKLACPQMNIVIDSINGKAVNGDNFTLPAGGSVSIVGHIGEADEVDASFNGKITANIKDAKETIVCNDWDRCGKKFTYEDYTSTIFNGTDSIRGGKFNLHVAIPLDISYSDIEGLMTFYAINSDNTKSAHGLFNEYVLNGSAIEGNDSIGPSIYCYLNSPSFVDGQDVNTTPYFYAEVNDKDGVNTSTSGIGHEMVLIIDGDMYQTYNLNDYFLYDFGTFTSGSLSYSLPELTEGPHTLLFRAWDMLNNSSSTQLTFNVKKGIDSKIYDIYATENPARYNTQFVLRYDRPGSPVDITFEVYDMLGRLIWRKTENNVYTNGTYYMTWNLQSNNHQDVGTGVYLYRARVACEGSSESLKAKKIIVVRQ
ncbi:MAG: type IX secretion system sortase PorU [Prevotellaceae bacterium]|nr:type IX secretion system sortase PorU [Prevotellaceae bacterium]